MPYAKAGFFNRFLAFSIDLGLNLLFILAVYYLASIVLGYDPYDSFQGLRMVIAVLFFYLSFVIYHIAFVALEGATPGKMILGLKVVALDGQRVSIARAVFRAFGYYLSASFCLLGFLWALFDPHNQTWHDKLAGTTVREV